MKFKLKTAGLAAAAVGMMVLTSAVSESNVPLEVGIHAPELTVANPDGSSLNLADLKGENVIVNFWSVRDAESRISNIRLANDAERSGAKFISLCVDSDRALAAEVLKADRIPSESSFFANEKIKEDFLLDSGVRTVKIDPYGIVAAID